MPDTKVRSINPATEEVLAEFDLLTDDQLEQKVQKAAETYEEFKRTTFAQRAQWMKRVGDLLEQKADTYGRTVTLEIGRPIKQGISEPKKCAKWARWYAENAERILKERSVDPGEPGKQAKVIHEPMGILLQIAPFNYPFLQCIRFLAACLMAGNVALIRHSHTTMISAYHIESCFKEAGFPDGVVQIIAASKDQVSKLIQDYRIKGVTLTGSVKAGKSVAKQAGENMKPHVMELGGSDAYIICDDVDLKEVIPQCVKGRTVNNGQSCTSAKRFIVFKGIYDEFCELLTQKMKELKMGDPLKEENELGPLARSDLRDNVHNCVQKAVNEGAKLLTGGHIPQNMKGFFYPATVLADVTPDNVAFKEEIFGPVATVIKAENEKHAIELCNNSQYGLGGGVFTKDEKKGECIARNMNVGLAFVNRIVTSSPQYPFGGVKNSGYGKECGEEGILQWVNTKSLIIK